MYSMPQLAFWLNMVSKQEKRWTYTRTLKSPEARMRQANLKVFSALPQNSQNNSWLFAWPCHRNRHSVYPSLPGQWNRAKLHFPVQKVSLTCPWRSTPRGILIADGSASSLGSPFHQVLPKINAFNIEPSDTLNSADSNNFPSLLQTLIWKMEFWSREWWHTCSPSTQESAFSTMWNTKWDPVRKRRKRKRRRRERKKARGKRRKNNKSKNEASNNLKFLKILMKSKRKHLKNCPKSYKIWPISLHTWQWNYKFLQVLINLWASCQGKFKDYAC